MQGTFNKRFCRTLSGTEDSTSSLESLGSRCSKPSISYTNMSLVKGRSHAILKGLMWKPRVDFEEGRMQSSLLRFVQRIEAEGGGSRVRNWQLIICSPFLLFCFPSRKGHMMRLQRAIKPSRTSQVSLLSVPNIWSHPNVYEKWPNIFPPPLFDLPLHVVIQLQ